MTRIKTKNDLINWLGKYSSRRAIQGALLEGKIELLGWFTPAPGSSNPGWIVVVTSKHGLVWNVVVSPRLVTGKLNSYVVDEIDWKNYKGGNTPLFAGDNPERYKELK